MLLEGKEKVEEFIREKGIKHFKAVLSTKNLNNETLRDIF